MGAHVEPFINLPGMRELVLQEASDEQLAYIPPLQRLIYEEYEALLTISSEENTRCTRNILHRIFLSSLTIQF